MWLALVCAALPACADVPVAATEAGLIYGADDRREPYDHPDPAWAARTREFSVALIPAAGAVAPTSFGQAKTLCPGEPFADQSSESVCSGTLIVNDLVLTAGHCVPDQQACEALKFVFGYAMDAAGTLSPRREEDVFGCAELVVQRFEADQTSVDYAVVRLDRPVVGRRPARVMLEDLPVSNEASLALAGFPSGLPLKLADGKTRDAREHTLDYFTSNLDVLPGSSGSGVFDRERDTLLGVLTGDERGHFQYDPAAMCFRQRSCAEDGCAGNTSSYAQRAVEALCSELPDHGLCQCGDGICSGAESASTCSLDCGPDGQGTSPTHVYPPPAGCSAGANGVPMTTLLLMPTLLLALWRRGRRRRGGRSSSKSSRDH